MPTRRVSGLASVAAALVVAALVIVSCGEGSGSIRSAGSAAARTTTTTTKVTGARAASTANKDDFADIPNVVRTLEPSVVTIETSGGLGSGVVWSADGTIVTDAHVVGSNKDVQVDFADGRQVKGTVTATDTTTDVAILKADRTGLTPATFETRLPALGDLAIAVGSPLGFTNSVTAGVISGEDRSIPGSADQTQSLVDLIQTDAAVSPGNSGGALANGIGAVVGLVEAYIPPSQGAVSLGFATPAGTVVDVAKQLIATGHASHAYFGIQAASLTPQIQEQLGTNRSSGVAVLAVQSGSPARTAGLQPGDVILSVDGKPVATAEDLIGILRQRKPGDRMAVTYARGSTQKTVTVTLSARPES